MPQPTFDEIESLIRPDDFAERTRQAAEDAISAALRDAGRVVDHDICRQERADLDAVVAAIETAEPHLKNVPATHPYRSLQDAILYLWTAAHRTGTAEGAIAEQVRQVALRFRTSPTPTHRTPMEDEPDAAEFADAVVGEISGHSVLMDGIGSFAVVAQENRAEIDALFAATIARHPELGPAYKTFDHPFGRLGDAVSDAIIVAHRVGIREGAAAEYLRRTMIDSRTPTTATKTTPPPDTSATADSLFTDRPDIEEPDDEAGDDERDDEDRSAQIERQRAILNDPIRFAARMREPLFYAFFDALFLNDDLGPYAAWSATLNAIRAAGNRPGPELRQAVENFENLRWDISGEAVVGLGIPMGIALEQVRRILIDCLAQMQKAENYHPTRQETQRPAA